ncbi:CCA tRNA nucleotidyltransferase [Haladaptatus sp. YSMS36]|uniref:CCA tRNA nucleotidyltransferase n=1 Tax=Haladaptatus sp. YSMS36 TaxID=3033384 RepID=UPI0023E76C80|nr:CCA tRNA nucleotidyltransferase [Haladaptatus sp. YSMS36]
MTERDEYERVFESVRAWVEPDADEQARLTEAAAALLERTGEAIADLGVEADTILVGSTARGTWISGDRDIDVFVRFPESLAREELERFGLQIGATVLPDGQKEYAEHPYTKGDYDGFSVDLVPCYAVPTAADIKSAVDRTPFHTEYLDDHLTDDLAGEVRLAKQFLKGIGSYGSDLRTEGFSGYLTELLILEYGSLLAFLEAAADWKPPVKFDPENHGQRSFTDPLVVIDPTDPRRNVAAAVSPANVARLQHHARAFLVAPSETMFIPATPDPLNTDQVRMAIDRRGTIPIAVRFETPDIVEDQLYPQLRKSIEGMASELDRRGFDVLRTATFAAETAVLFAELEVASRPAIERHEGPPVHVREHATGFYEKYADDPDAFGPFIDGDRYVVERDREFTTARAFLESEALFDVALGATIQRQVEKEYEVLAGSDVADLAGEFGAQLAHYFSPKP